jgi:hypothetical protein
MKRSQSKVVTILIASLMAISCSTAIFVYAGTPEEQQKLKTVPRETARDGNFIAFDNGTVLDMRTKLMWAAKDNGSSINWADANSYCESYRGGGFTDWRMPTPDELAGLYDEAKAYTSNCDYDVRLTALIRLTCTFVWSSERSGSDVTIFAFHRGKRAWTDQSTSRHTRALPVRSGK